MPWQIYLFISIILISCNALFHRSLMKNSRSDPRAQTIVFLGLGGVIALVLALLQNKLQLAIPLHLWPNFVLLALLATPAYVMIYQAYRLLDASQVVLFLITGRLWGMVGAYIFLHETISAQKIFGALVILAGVIIARFDRKKFTINQGVIFALLAAFCFGMNDINGFYISKEINAANLLIYANFLPVLVLLILQPKVIKKLQFYWQKDNAIKVGFLGLCDTLGSLSLILAFQAGGKASVISPLNSTRVILTVILAAIFLGEKENLKTKLLGAVVTVIGILFLV